MEKNLLTFSTIVEIFKKKKTKKTMTKEQIFISELKKEGNFFPYVRLKHNKVLLHELIEDKRLLKILTKPTLEVFKVFLSENNTSIQQIYKQVDAHDRTDMRSDKDILTSSFPIPCWQYINYCLTWSKTKEGRPYWRDLHNAWVNYIMTNIISPITNARLQTLLNSYLIH